MEERVKGQLPAISREGQIAPEDLVYQPRGGSNEVNQVAMARMVKDSAFRFQETNGDYIKGNCYGYWEGLIILRGILDAVKE